MLCVASFAVFLVLGIFSAAYRELAGKAWYCIVKKIQFKPCDINFNEELKGKLLGKFIITHPRLARFLDKWIDWLSLIFVILSIWSLIAVLLSGLNLLVYDTCNPSKAESCSLAGEACSIQQETFTLVDVAKTGRLDKWAYEHVSTFLETVSRVPDRFKEWMPEEYINETNTYYLPFSEEKPTALEIIDPGCTFCAKLFKNIKEAGFEKSHNVTYTAYPIPDPNTEAGYKFKNSHLITRYLEAMKMVEPQKKADTPPDWQLLELIFTKTNEIGSLWQDEFNFTLNHEEAEHKLRELLIDFGYSPAQVDKVSDLANSEAINQIVVENAKLVEEEVKTIKIPTIIFDGRRYDRVIGPEKLK